MALERLKMNDKSAVMVLSVAASSLGEDIDGIVRRMHSSSKDIEVLGVNKLRMASSKTFTADICTSYYSS